MSDIRIVAPADPGDAAFLASDDYAPFLQFGTHPDHAGEPLHTRQPDRWRLGFDPGQGVDAPHRGGVET